MMTREEYLNDFLPRMEKRLGDSIPTAIAEVEERIWKLFSPEQKSMMVVLPRNFNETIRQIAMDLALRQSDKQGVSYI